MTSRLAIGEVSRFAGLSLRRVQGTRFSTRRGAWGLALLWVAELALAIALVRHGRHLQSALAQVAIGAALGGAGGNVLDRLARGSVVDFVDLRVWPVFNLADLAIVTGALVGALRA